MKQPTRKRRKEKAMRSLVVFALCAAFVTSQAVAAESMKPKTKKEKISYTYGTKMGENVKKQQVDIDQKMLIQGFRDALSGAKYPLSKSEMVTATEDFQKEGAAKQQEQNRIVAEKNLKESKAYLAKNAKKKGVVVRPSGLQYKVITKGKGKKPKATDKVIVKYKASLSDGTVFDDTDKHKVNPAIMPISGDSNLIDGWTEALMLMKEGARWEIVIPPSLGFKDRRVWTVGPNSVLIFDVELISIQ
jgi:FKBP-type peptidyl-prolyl cis-trans isomerase FklB